MMICLSILLLTRLALRLYGLLSSRVADGGSVPRANRWMVYVG